MSEFPLGYERIQPATWVYLSSLLMIGLFFKFNRTWSVRNFDLVLLILLSPGLLLVVLGENRVYVDTAERLNVASSENEVTSRVTEPIRGVPTAGQERSGLGNSSSPEVAPPPDDVSASSRPTPGLSTSPDTDVSIDESLLPSEEDALRASTTARASTDGARRGQVMQLVGYIWLLLVGFLFVARMLLDPTMVRRPLLEPNLTTGGLIFIGCSLFIFLMANVINSRPTRDDLEGPRSAEQLVRGHAIDKNDDSLTRHGPGYAVFHVIPSIPTVAMSRDDNVPRGISSVRTWTYGVNQQFDAEYLGKTADGNISLRDRQGNTRAVPLQQLSETDRSYLRKLGTYTVIAKAMAILGNLALILGIVAVGYWHFDNLKMGVGVATLYLMLPYTALMTGRVDHVIPAALLVWAIYFYRSPLVSGMFIGLAAGVVYYPLFLLPLWLSFYWQRGLVRFSVGMLSMLAVLALSLVLVSGDFASFLANLRKMFGIWLPVRSGLQGIWGLGWDPNFRWPVLSAFGAMSGTFAIWPAQKNLGTLLSCSAALMVATQFWHGFGGGLYMAWYLPLALLTIFRPNLEDRVALTVLGESWLSRRKRQHPSKTGLAA